MNPLNRNPENESPSAISNFSSILPPLSNFLASASIQQTSMTHEVTWLSPFFHQSFFPASSQSYDFSIAPRPLFVNNINMDSFLSAASRVGDSVNVSVNSFSSMPPARKHGENENQIRSLPLRKMSKTKMIHNPERSTLKDGELAATLVSTSKIVERKRRSNVQHSVVETTQKNGKSLYDGKGSSSASSITPSLTTVKCESLDDDESRSSFVIKKELEDNDTRTIHEPIVVGNYSNPFEKLQNKMRDGIDLYRYLWLVDRFGSCKRPTYRPFLLRNLRYMERKRRKTKTLANDNGMNGLQQKGGSTEDNDNKVASHLITNALHAPKLQPQKYSMENGELVATAVKFNFIRNNLCFGDGSAIVQCFHVTEIDCQLGIIQRIPSATFSMKVNEKLSHVSIDLPDSFGTDFIIDHKSRAEHFVVKVVFRYENAEVGGGKRLRKMPSRERSSGDEKLQTLKRKSNDKFTLSTEKLSNNAEEVVMFGTKPIVSYSKEGGLTALHGETSIVLHSHSELNIDPSNNDWTRNTSFLAHIQRLQRKTFDNPFMSVQVHNDGDEDDDDSDDDLDEIDHNKCKNRSTKCEEVTQSKLTKTNGVGTVANGIFSTAEKRHKISESNVSRKKNARTVDESLKVLNNPIKPRRRKLPANTSRQVGCKRKRVEDSDSTDTRIASASDVKTSQKGKDNANLSPSLQTSIALVSDDFINMDDVLSGGEMTLPKKIALRFVHSGTVVDRNKPTTNTIFFGLASVNCRNANRQDLVNRNENTAVVGVPSDGHPMRMRLRAANACNLSTIEDNDVKNDFFFANSDEENEDVEGLPLKHSANLFLEDDDYNGHGDKDMVVIRVLNTAHLCFFCLNQLDFKSLNALTMHLRLCHPRFKFLFEENIVVSKHLTLPGFMVTLNPNFDSSCEINPVRHYIKHSSEVFRPRHITALVDPIWIVTKQFSRKVRRNWMSLEKSVKEAELYNSTLFKDALMSGEIRLGARYTFKPPTKINHPWMIQANSRRMGEITDLHPCERAIMQMWNEFLLDIRITLLGRNMVYKASRVFVENYRECINSTGLRVQFLLHLVNLNNLGCIDDEERYDLFRRLDQSYNPLQDDVHYVSRHLEALNRERARYSFKRGGESGCRTGSASNLQLLVDRETPESSGGSAPPENCARNITNFESLDSLRVAFPSASLRRLELLWRFLDIYTIDTFKMI